MLQVNTVLDRAEAVRQKTLTILSSLTDRARAFGLPDPATSLAQYRQKLVDNTYQVLVVGEAKRGKSTFVNALIGRDILPTDVDIATSQVFRVGFAEREAYRLRFEDDTQQVIGVGDLARFGSQVVADADGLPRLDQIIRWIEVDVPARFLPANVRILDTPGLGALYASHAPITHGLVPHADAVLFILDSRAPIGEPEIQFVAELLKVTRNILFVQTRIDQVRRDAWQEIQRRNQEILEKRFGESLADKQVWPISSVNLRKAAQTGDEDYLMVSRHRELSLALAAFLFRVSGWSRSADAVEVAGQYQTASRQLLSTRLAALTEESKQKRAEYKQRAAERRQQFESDWGERGKKRHELLRNIQTIAGVGKQAIRSALLSSGEVEEHFRARIHALTGGVQNAELLRSALPESLRGGDVRDAFADCEQAIQSLPHEVEAYVLALWQKVQKTTEAKCADVLAPFLLEMEAVMTTPTTASSSQRNATKPESHDESAEKILKTAAFGALATGAVGGAVQWVAPIFVPIIGLTAAPFLVGTAAILAIGSAKILAEKRAQLKAGKQEYLRALSDQLARLRNDLLFEPDLVAGRFNRLDECFNSLERTLGAKIAELASEKLAEARAEIDRLEEESRLDDQRRQEKAEETRRDLAEWDGLGIQLQEIRNELHALERGQGAAAVGQASSQSSDGRVQHR